MGLSRLLVLLVVLFLCSGLAAAQDSPFTETFEVTRTDWYRGEEVALRYEQCNTSSSSAELCVSNCPPLATPISISNANSGAEVSYWSSGPTGCNPACTPTQFQPGQCYTETYEWPQIEGAFPPDLPIEPTQVPRDTYFAQSGIGNDAVQTQNFQLHANPPPIPTLGGMAMTILAALLMMVGGRWTVRR